MRNQVTSVATRTEQLHFLLAVNKQQAETYAADIRTIVGDQDSSDIWTTSALPEDGTLKITYDVWLNYFGHVETKLAAITRLLDVPDLVQKISLDELQRGHSILIDIIRRIETLQHKLGGIDAHD
jgi:hypothetical protein